MSGTIEIIVVMRHGCRADKAGEEWSESETRPWDSPLSKKGWKETVRSGKELNKLLKRKPDLIFTSPYHTLSADGICTREDMWCAFQGYDRRTGFIRDL